MTEMIIVIFELSELFRPDSPEGGEDGVEDAEGEGHLYADPVEAGATALVEAGQSLSPGYLPQTVPAGPADNLNILDRFYGVPISL